MFNDKNLHDNAKPVVNVWALYLPKDYFFGGCQARPTRAGKVKSTEAEPGPGSLHHHHRLGLYKKEQT